MNLHLTYTNNQVNINVGQLPLQTWIILVCLMWIVESAGSDKPEVFHMEERCGNEINMERSSINSGILNFSLDNAGSDLTDCEIIIKTGNTWQYMSFYFLAISNEDPACYSFVVATTGTKPDRYTDWSKFGKAIGRRYRFCYSSDLPSLDEVHEANSHQQLMIKMTRNLPAPITTINGTFFSIYFNTYQKFSCSGDDLFQCANYRCISKQLKCSDYNPCGDSSDCPEPVVEDASEPTPLWQLLAYAGGSIFGFILFIMWVKKCHDGCNSTDDNDSSADEMDDIDIEDTRNRFSTEGQTFLPSPVPTAPPIQDFNGRPEAYNTHVNSQPEVSTAHAYAPPAYPADQNNRDGDFNIISTSAAPPSYDFVMENADVFKVNDK